MRKNIIISSLAVVAMTSVSVFAAVATKSAPVPVKFGGKPTGVVAVARPVTSAALASEAILARSGALRGIETGAIAAGLGRAIAVHGIKLQNDIISLANKMAAETNEAKKELFAVRIAVIATLGDMPKMECSDGVCTLTEAKLTNGSQLKDLAAYLASSSSKELFSLNDEEKLQVSNSLLGFNLGDMTETLESEEAIQNAIAMNKDYLALTTQMVSRADAWALALANHVNRVDSSAAKDIQGAVKLAQQLLENCVKAAKN